MQKVRLLEAPFARFHFFLQPWIKYLSQPLVFMLNIALRNLFFSSILLVLIKVLFWVEE